MLGVLIGWIVSRFVQFCRFLRLMHPILAYCTNLFIVDSSEATALWHVAAVELNLLVLCEFLWLQSMAWCSGVQLSWSKYG